MFTTRNTIVALTAGILAAAFAAGPALAETETAFAGPYVAAIGGWDRMQADHHKQDGFVYGGNAGYDFAAGKVRFGPEIAVTGSTEKGCGTDLGRTDCTRAGRDFFVGGRVGVVAAPKALVYLTAGYTNARYTGSISQGTTRIANDDDHSGARIGAGIEYAVTRALFVKTEYRYSNYSNGIARNQVIGGVGVRF